MSRGPIVLLAAVLAVLLSAPTLAAQKDPRRALHPTDRCAADKVRALASTCQAIFEAEAARVGGDSKASVEGRIVTALQQLHKRYAKAEARTSTESCEDLSATPEAHVGAIQRSAAVLAASLVQDPDDANQTACARDILSVAKTTCRNLLRADGKHLLKRAKDRDRVRLEKSYTKALDGLAKKFAKKTAKAECSPPSTAQDLEDAVTSLRGDVVRLATNSPAVSEDWMMITPDPVVYNNRFLTPICSRGTPYVFFAKRGTVNKLVVYYQGGGACWDAATCGLDTATYKEFAGPGDNPEGFASGLADPDNPENPFRNWSQVMVPYCTGDVHWGDATYLHSFPPPSPIDPVVIEHRGYTNAQVVEKWTREHFNAPEQVFVSGSSAGAYGAILHSIFFKEFVYPSTEFVVIGDAGNGVITNDFLVNDFNKWGIEDNLPDFVPGLEADVTTLELSELYGNAANQYPDSRFATYTTAYDGGSGGQTGFYNLMLTRNLLGALSWWQGSCMWNQEMLRLNGQSFALAPDNYRSYVGTGSAHTTWGRNKVYDDTTGNVPTFVSWVNAMLDDTPDWVNVLCEDCGTTLDGDPRPPLLDPGQPELGYPEPFDVDGNIDCSPAP